MTTLAGTLPALQTAYDQLIAYGRALDIGLAVADYGGLRTQGDTTTILGYRQADYNAALKAGSIRPDTTLQQFRPIAPFGESFHNYGAAFDLKITARPSGWTDDTIWSELGAIAPEYGLRWGGTFSNPDVDHFELDESLAQAAQDYADMIAGDGGASGASSPLGSAALPWLAGLAAAGAVVVLLVRRFAR